MDSFPPEREGKSDKEDLRESHKYPYRLPKSEIELRIESFPYLLFYVKILQNVIDFLFSTQFYFKENIYTLLLK